MRQPTQHKEEPVNEGDLVEEFELADQNGAIVSLSELLAVGPLVLFFFPKAMTPG